MAIKLEEKTLIKFIRLNFGGLCKCSNTSLHRIKIPVFDAYHSNIIDSYNPAFRNKCMVDGLHPNELVHEVITYELLKTIITFMVKRRNNKWLIKNYHLILQN